MSTAISVNVAVDTRSTLSGKLVDGKLRCMSADIAFQFIDTLLITRQH